METCVRIRRARTKAGLSQADLGSRVGVNRSAVAQWERVGGTSPSVDNLAKVALITGVAFEWLATGRGGGELAEVPAVAMDYAVDEAEARVLECLRLLPSNKRKRFCDLLELILR